MISFKALWRIGFNVLILVCFAAVIAFMVAGGQRSPQIWEGIIARVFGSGEQEIDVVSFSCGGGKSGSILVTRNSEGKILDMEPLKDC